MMVKRFILAFLIRITLNYKLTTKIIDFNLNFDEDEILISNKTQITLLRGDNRIENPTFATIQQIIDRTETKSNIFSLQIRKSESFEVGKHVDMSFEIGLIFSIY
jgi:hypothetical protein